MKLGEKPVSVRNIVVNHHKHDLPGSGLKHGGLEVLPLLAPIKVKLVDNLWRRKRRRETSTKSLGTCLL